MSIKPTVYTLNLGVLCCVRFFKTEQNVAILNLLVFICSRKLQRCAFPLTIGITAGYRNTRYRDVTDLTPFSPAKKIINDLSFKCLIQNQIKKPVHNYLESVIVLILLFECCTVFQHGSSIKCTSNVFKKNDETNLSLCACINNHENVTND